MVKSQKCSRTQFYSKRASGNPGAHEKYTVWEKHRKDWNHSRRWKPIFWGINATPAHEYGRWRVLSIMSKIPEISVGIQMIGSVSVSSDRNIRDHLWRWSTYFGRNISTKFAVPFLTNRFFVLIREFGKGIKKMERAIPIGWPGLIGKWRSIFLGYFHWSLNGRFGIMESTRSFRLVLHC